jgi:ADP-L-glycero-D-manno-heptose 6-epimerase
MPTAASRIAIRREKSSDAAIAYADMPEGIRDKYQYFTEARMDRLQQAGYAKPFATLEEGIGDYVSRYLSQADPYR